MVVDFLPVLKHREEVKSTRDAERHPYFLFKNFGKYRENVGINRFCMYVEGNEDDHSHQPYAEADKRVRSEAGQIQAVRGESRRIRPVGRPTVFPATVFVSVASGHLTLLAVGQVLQRSLEPAGRAKRTQGGVPVPGDNTPRIIDDRAGKSYRNRRPGPDHRGLPNMVMGGSRRDSPRPRKGTQ